VNGPPVRDIIFTDSTASGTWASTDATQPLTHSLLAGLLAGNIYVNAHTALHPAGEIRGQVTSGVAIKLAAQLEGSQEVPPTNSNAAGFGLFTLNATADSLRYQVGVMNLSGPITGAHFHNAAPGVNGGVVRDIQNDFSGDFANGVWTNTEAQALTPELAVELLAGKIYVNLHTAANPGGEVRGQVLPHAKIITPIGLARQLPDDTRNVSIEGVITTIDFNLSGATSSEFYLQDATGGMRMFVGNGKAALAQGQRVRVKESTIASNAGRKNIETAPDSLVVLDAPGLPAPQVVTVDFYLNNRAAIEGEFIRINNANFTDTFPAANSNKTITINDGTGELALFIDRDTDIDGSPEPRRPVNIIGVATSFNNAPQIQPSWRSDFCAPITFFAQLTGSQEHPPVATTAAGVGMFVLNEEQTELSYNVSTTGLSGPSTAAHFHNAAAGVNGPIVRAITFTGETASGVWSSTDTVQALTPVLLVELLAGKLYVNVHTAANPNGEIRGQVLPNAPAIMPIAVARQTADGNVVTVEGIVIRALGRFARLQDETAGLTVFENAGAFRAAIDSGRVRQGDRLRLTGTLAEFNSLKEIAPIDSFEVLARDNPLPAAQLVTLAEIARNGEAYESELIRVEGLRINAGADSVFVAGRTYAITDASDQSGAVVLRTPAANDTRIAGVAIPKGTAAFEGVLGQFSSTNPAAGYQLSPVLATDVSPLTSVDEQSSELPEQFALLQNYPNPFNPTTVIRYALPRHARVKLVIYNLLGKKVRTLVDANETPGFKQITWNGANDASARVASGIYIYRLETADFRATRKLALMK